LSALQLEPGAYEVRVAAIGADVSRVASVFTHISVPDYATAPLSLSHVVVGAADAANAIPRDFLADALPVVPTAQRALSRGSDTTAFVQIYQATMRRTAVEPVAVRARILDATGQIVRDQTARFVAASFRPHRTASARLTLPVRNLAPGDYVLDLQATTESAHAERRVRFEVR
jgi:hypothetical protein